MEEMELEKNLTIEVLDYGVPNPWKYFWQSGKIQPLAHVTQCYFLFSLF